MKQRVFGLVFALLGLLLILTPRLIFPVCGVGRYAPPEGQAAGYHACHGTLKAETVLGAAAILVGSVAFLWPKRRVLAATSVLGLVTAVLAACFPLFITGMCKMPTMACRLGTQPALVTIAVLMAIAAAAGLAVSKRTP